MVGSPSVGYKTMSVPNATFNHSAGMNMFPAGMQSVTYSPLTPMPAIATPLAYPGVAIPVQPDPIVTVVSPERHIYEQQSFNSWQGNNPGDGPIVPMIPGTGSFTITGDAPIGQTVEDQALTNESINY